MKRIYISVINDLVTDQRVHRVASLLADREMKVTCIGRKLSYSADPEIDRVRTRRFRMLFTRGPFFYASFNVRLFFTLLFVRNPSLFIANDLDTLPANFMASRIRKVPLIYDSHEFFTQVPELINRKSAQAVWKWIEHRYLPRLQHAVTVSYSIAVIYRRLHGTKFRVVRNVPARKVPVGGDEIRKAYGGKSLIIYQGALNMGRGLELMIETMQCVEGAVFIIAGTGDIEDKLKHLVEEKEVADKVEFRGRMSPGELFRLTCAADLGISLEEDLGLNYRYALPNKLFDYIQCRVPVLCSALPEMSKVVESYGIGVVVRDRDPIRMAGTVRYMLKERSAGAWREALEKAAGELSWEKESEEYLRMLEDCGVL